MAVFNGVDVQGILWSRMWAPWQVTTIPVRQMSERERRDMANQIDELATLSLGQRNPPNYAYISMMGDIISGGCPKKDLPQWTTVLWAEEEDHLAEDDRLESMHDFDRAMMDCDLARLSFFLRSEEGKKVKSWLKDAWMRVTLALPCSMYAIAEGENSIMAFSVEGLQVAREYGSPRFGYFSPHEAFLALTGVLTRMSHGPWEEWVRDLHYDTSSTEELDSN